MQKIYSWFLILAMMSVAALPAIAQEPDSEPPVLELAPVSRGVIDQDQVFEISATDNEGSVSVVLVYRVGESTDVDYQRLDMDRVGQSDVYSVTLPASSIGQQARVIQYYIEATDAVGNRRLEGFSFNPLVRTLVEQGEYEQSQALGDATGETFLSGLSTRQKIVYGALTVLTVGVLISASDSGGSSVAAGVETTITAQPPLNN